MGGQNKMWSAEFHYQFMQVFKYASYNYKIWNKNPIRSDHAYSDSDSEWQESLNIGVYLVLENKCMHLYSNILYNNLRHIKNMRFSIISLCTFAHRHTLLILNMLKTEINIITCMLLRVKHNVLLFINNQTLDCFNSWITSLHYRRIL